jgi:flavin-dependent dehydrogenase
VQPRRCEVLIAGAGPAGLATALHLLRRRPDLAGKVIALERARHPRAKVCAGGLIPKTLAALDELGLELSVPAAVVRRGIAVSEAGRVDLPGDDVLCKVIRRDQFDASLARAAMGAGLEIVEDCRVLEVNAGTDEVRAVTERGEVCASLMVGADGSGSRVREQLFAARGSIGRALMLDLPADSDAVEFAEAAYRFDFTCVTRGIAGYAWSFPCIIEGRPHLNIGIYDQFAGGQRTNRDLLTALAAAFPELEVDPGARARYKAFPIRWYDPTDRFVAGPVLLAGDAAGIDPLMGEGISFAFEHGKLAAAAIDAYLTGDLQALAEYDRRLHRGSIARKLRRLRFAARRFYGPHHRWYFRLAGLSRTTQRIGIDWYNGVRGLDELPTLALAGKWARAVLSGRVVS